MTAFVWRADGSGEPLLLEGHRGVVLSVQFSPDGSKLISCSQDRTCRVWTYRWPDLVAKLRQRFPGACLGEDERARHLGEDRETARAEARACEEQ